MKRACRIGIIIITVYGTVILGTFLVPCLPVRAFWDKSVKGKCIGNLPFWYTASALNIVTDVGIFVLPLPVLAKLKLPMRQKVGLMGVLTIGML
jgi:hypothetical protein